MAAYPIIHIDVQDPGVYKEHAARAGQWLTWPEYTPIKRLRPRLRSATWSPSRASSARRKA